MIRLLPVTEENFYECTELKREEWKFVGDAYAVLADAYLYRDTSLAYAIYLGEKVIGIVILDEKGKDGVYEFTDLFLDDDYKGKGYATEVIEAILNHFKAKSAKSVRMQVNKDNVIAIHVYRKCGFEESESVPWNDDFLFMKKRLAEEYHKDDC